MYIYKIKLWWAQFHNKRNIGHQEAHVKSDSVIIINYSISFLLMIK